MKNKLDFSLEGVTGQLTLEYGPFKQRLYQDGQLLKPSKGKYRVQTTSGETEELKIKFGIDLVHTVTFRGRTISLEKRLSTLEYIIGGIPILLIFTGGLLGVVIGFMGVCWTCNYLRTEKRTGRQIAAALGIGVLCLIVYLAIAVPLQLMAGPR